MVKVVGNPEFIGYQFVVDLSVNDKSGGNIPTNSYLIVLPRDESDESGSARYIISHNTVSLLAGVTPGVHFPTSKFYIRRVRIPTEFPLLPILVKAGYKVEPCIGSEKTTSVIEFPMKYSGNVRTQDDVSMWEKLSLSAFMQEHWADNQVSVTITFDPKTEGNQIKHALDYFQHKLKSVSFLPSDTTAYLQKPYEKITEEQYNEMISKLKKIDIVNIRYKNNAPEDEQDAYCDSDKCGFVPKNDSNVVAESINLLSSQDIQQ